MDREGKLIGRAHTKRTHSQGGAIWRRGSWRGTYGRERK